MNKCDLAAGLDAIRHRAINAVASTVSLAKPATVAAGLGHAAHYATKAAASTASLAKPVTATVAAGLGHATHYTTNAVSSTASLAKPENVAAGLGYVKQHAAAMVSTREGAVTTAAVVLSGAVGAYILWPAAAVPAAVGATMKAPGAMGFAISRAAFLANPQLYFQILRTAGAAAAAAAFAVAP